MINESDLDVFGYYDSILLFRDEYFKWVEIMIIILGDICVVENIFGFVGEVGEVVEKIKKKF